MLIIKNYYEKKIKNIITKEVITIHFICIIVNIKIMNYDEPRLGLWLFIIFYLNVNAIFFNLAITNNKLNVINAPNYDSIRPYFVRIFKIIIVLCTQVFPEPHVNQL